MSTVAEIERALEQLPPEQWAEVRRWMDSRERRPCGEGRAHDLAKFDEWLSESTGLAKGLLTTDERMRQTRGED